MAKQVIALEATLNSAPAEGSVKSLKAQLREAQAEVQTMSDKFGLTSDQAQKAARKAAELKDAIGDAKSLTDAFNPDAKFKAFGSAIQGVVGGFTALQGAQALFGSKSEELEKTLLKVQGAMALSQGLNALGEAGDSFKVLGVKAVEAFNKIKVAIGSTGIGLLVVALGTIYAYWDDIKEAVSGVSEEQEKLNAKTITNLDAEKEKLTQLNGQDNILKLQGKTEKEILGLKINQYDAVIKATEAQITQSEITKTAQVEAAKRNKDILEGILKYISAPIMVVLKGIDLIGKAVGKNFGLEEKFYGGLSKFIFDPEETAKNGDKTIKEQKNALAQLKNDRAGFQLQIQAIDSAAATKNKKDSDTKKQEAEDDTLYLLESTMELLDKQEAATKEYYDIEKSFREQDYLDQYNADLAAIELDKKTNEQLNAGRKVAAEESIAISKAESEAKQQLNNAYLDSVSAGIGILKMFADKNKGLQKALLIAENGVTIARIILDTQRSIVSARASVAGISPFLPGPVPIPNPKYILAQTIANANIAQSKIAAGIGIAQALAATAKGLSSIGSGGSAGGGGGINTGGGLGGNGGSGGVASPIAPQLSNTILNQQAINQTGNAAIRSYVVESDVAGNQERIERLNRAARIN